MSRFAGRIILCYYTQFKGAVIKKYITGLFCLIWLSSCGFQLRGAYKLPFAMQTTYIEAEQPASALIRGLKLGLKENGINVINENSDDAAVLKVYKESRSKRIVSVDSRGRAREYTLSYSVSFSVLASAANFEMQEQVISLDRDFLFDAEDVLGNSRGESQIYDEMQLDIQRLILLRLQSRA